MDESVSATLDHVVELGVIIGKGGRGITKENARKQEPFDGGNMKRVLISLLATICFVALYVIGAYLGDLVGIGGYDGLVSEDLYMAYQIGDVEPWLYRATELGALACLGIGVAGAALSLVAAGAFIGVGIVRSVRRGS